MKILLGILQLMTFVVLAVISVHAFMLQAYVAKQRKRGETSGPIAESSNDLNHVPIPDPLIHGVSNASRPSREHVTKTRIA